MKILEEELQAEYVEEFKSLLPGILDEDEIVEFAKQGVFQYGYGNGHDGMLMITNKRLLHVEVEGNGNEYENIVSESMAYGDIHSLVIRHSMTGDTERDINIEGNSTKFNVESLGLDEWNKFEQSILSKMNIERDSKSTSTSVSYTKKAVSTDEEMELEA